MLRLLGITDGARRARPGWLGRPRVVPLVLPPVVAVLVLVLADDLRHPARLLALAVAGLLLATAVVALLPRRQRTRLRAPTRDR